MEGGWSLLLFKNDGLQNQAVLYMQKTPYSEPAVVIDPNTFSDDGTIALVNLAFNKNGTLLAYGVSHSGSDWQEVRAMEVDSGRSYDDVIEWCRSSLSWSGDKGFFTAGILSPAPLLKKISSAITGYTGMSSARRSPPTGLSTSDLTQRSSPSART